MHRGYIKIFRKLKDNWLYSDDKKLLAWVKILMEVNHTKKPVIIKNTLLECDKGESLNSLDTWVDILGKDWNKSSVRRFFKLLEKDNMIQFRNETITSRLTLCNYDDYNDDNFKSETQTKRKRNASETQVKPNNNVKNDNNVNNTSSDEQNFKNTSFKKWDIEMFKDSIRDANKNNEYDDSLRLSFYNHWIEPNDKGKMKFQLNETWSTKGRLTTFKRNREAWNKK